MSRRAESQAPAQAFHGPWPARHTHVVGVPGWDNGAVKEDGVGIPSRWAASDEVPHNVVALDHRPLLESEDDACAAGGRGGGTMQQWALCRSSARCRRGDGHTRGQMRGLACLHSYCKLQKERPPPPPQGKGGRRTQPPPPVPASPNLKARQEREQRNRQGVPFASQEDHATNAAHPPKEPTSN